jgi:hypothetical protein
MKEHAPSDFQKVVSKHMMQSLAKQLGETNL